MNEPKDTKSRIKEDIWIIIFLNGILWPFILMVVIILKLIGILDLHRYDLVLLAVIFTCAGTILLFMIYKIGSKMKIK